MKNIKLVVTDLDGTLLNNQHELPIDFYDCYQQLKEKGLKFAIASGRQYYNIINKFEPEIIAESFVLAENGTYVKKGETELFVNEMPLEEARFFIKEGLSLPNTYVVLCGKKSAYIQENQAEICEKSEEFFERLTLVPDLLTIVDVVLKVTYMNYDKIEENIYPPLLEKHGKTHKIALAGHAFIDITPLGANKGKAIAFLQEKYQISPNETLVFGDMLNDYEMMQQAYFSYAMKNAHPAIKKIARFETEFDNTQAGVTQVLKQLLKIL